MANSGSQSDRNQAKAAERARRLRAELDRHDRLYYVEARPEISDRDYDRLYRELADLEEHHPDLATPDSPTRRVGGAPLKEFVSVRHAAPMLSLDNTYSREELLSFLERVARRLDGRACAFVVEPKIDGVAVTLRYEQGVLAQGCTRGNGEVGDDITANLRVIRSIPLRLAGAPPPPLLEVRGEVYMSRTGFAELNRVRREAGATPFANPRNAAAGSLKMLDSAQVARRPLAAVFYGLGAVHGPAPERHRELLEYLRSLGLPAPPRHWLCAGPAEVLQALDEMREMRTAFPFETDGAVIKVDERDLYETLGVTAKSPRWAVAFKFEPERAVTRLRAITVQVGRTGVLTPVAELAPVALAGSTINRATLHNADDIQRRDIRVGDLVTIEKAGEVIPVVTGVDIAARDGTEQVFAMPDNCPSCGGAVTRREGEIAWRCENLQCPAQLKRWIMHFASRNAMDIRNLGESLAEQLVDRGLVADPAELYRLTQAMLLTVPRLAEKSADNLLAGIAASRGRPLCNVIFALGIRQVGLGTARVLEGHYAGIDELGRATADDLSAIRDIGPVVARCIVDFFAAARIRDMLARLAAAGVNLRRLPGAVSGNRRFAGRNFVLTGALDRMTRSEAEAAIIRRGGSVTAGVSSKTAYVVAGRDPGSKLECAHRLNLPVLTEEEFMALLDEAAVSGAKPVPTEAPPTRTLNLPGELPLW